jgi:hypothetical protein
MQNLQLGWQQAAVLTGSLIAAHAVTSRSRGRAMSAAAPYLRESAIIAGLYGLWQLAAAVSVLGSKGAFERARLIVRFQHDVHLPSERSAQQVIAGHQLLAEACNLYYAGMHFGVLGVFLLWLFVRHRRQYPLVRNVLVLFTALSLLIQLIPVAPPRLLPDLGFIDTAAQYGQSVYASTAISVDELAAMPSVHVGWALLVAWAVIRISSSRFRWWVLAHPLVTIFVVVATANHFWSDGIVSGLLLGASIAVTRRLPRDDDRDASRARSVHGLQRGRDRIESDRGGDELVGTHGAGGD